MKDASLDLGTLSTAELAALKKKATDQLADTNRRGRFALFKPLEHQRPWFASRKQIVAAIGGNQMGKTTCGAIRLLSGALGTFPPSLGGTIPSSWERLDCRGQRYLMVAESFNTVIAKTIFPKVNCNPICARFLGENCRINWIGMNSSARITNGCNVININTETYFT